MGSSAPALGFVFIFMYLFSKLWGDFGAHLLFMSPSWTRTPPPFSAGCPPWHFLPSGLSSLLKPASLCQGLGTDIQKLFSLGSVPPGLFTHLLMCFTRPMLSWWQLCCLRCSWMAAGSSEELLRLGFHTARSPPNPPRSQGASQMPLPAPACAGAHCSPPGCSFSPHPAGVHGQVSVASPIISH